MACSRTFASIATECGANLGGIKNVYIAEYAEDIYTVSADTTSNLPKEISAISSGTTWQKFHFKKNSASFTSTLNVGDGGQYVSTEITMQFNRMETTKRLSIAALAVSEVAVIVEDQNGTYWAFGVGDSVTMSASTAQTGAAKGDGNFYSITLTDEFESYPLSIPSTVIQGLDIDDADITA